MVISVNTFHHVRLNHATWAELVYEMEQDLYVNVHQIGSVVNANIMIRAKYNHASGMKKLYSMKMRMKNHSSFVEIVLVIVSMIMHINVCVIKFIQEKTAKVC